MTILELREKRAKMWESAKSFLETHRDQNGTLSVEDDATYSKMENEIAAPSDGTVKQIAKEKGATVVTGDVLLVI